MSRTVRLHCSLCFGLTFPTQSLNACFQCNNVVKKHRTLLSCSKSNCNFSTIIRFLLMPGCVHKTNLLIIQCASNLLPPSDRVGCVLTVRGYVVLKGLTGLVRATQPQLGRKDRIALIRLQQVSTYFATRESRYSRVALPVPMTSFLSSSGLRTCNKVRVQQYDQSVTTELLFSHDREKVHVQH